MNNGWIKLHRRLIEWEWFTDSKTTHVFLYLLLTANHEDKEWRGITIKRGQVVTGRKKIAKATGLSERNVRTALSNLSNQKTTSELTIEPTNKYSLITIRNYEKFQITKDCDRPADRPADRPTIDQQPTTNKNVRIKEVKKEPKTRGGRFTPPTLKEVQDYCHERNNSVDPERWYDYQLARGWKLKGGQIMKDWEAAIRTWENNDFGNGKKAERESQLDLAIRGAR